MISATPEQTEFTAQIHKIALYHVTGDADFEPAWKRFLVEFLTIDDTVLRSEHILIELQTWLPTDAFEPLSIAERFEGGSACY